MYGIKFSQNTLLCLWLAEINPYTANEENMVSS
jgi:hypothetical protein